MKELTLADLVDDAAGEEGGRFLTVRVEVEGHQSVRPHGEVVVHGQHLRRTMRPRLHMYCTAECVKVTKA